MKNIKSNKAITLVALVVTVVMLLILSTVTITSLNTSNGAGRYNNMAADIKLLSDKVHVYYNKYGEIPKTEKTITVDAVQYYEIDLSKLGDLTLNYGKEYGGEGSLTSSSDVYVINQNLNVYYLCGVEKGNETYHQL